LNRGPAVNPKFSRPFFSEQPILMGRTLALTFYRKRHSIT
jgi:hypothetical protein